MIGVPPSTEGSADWSYSGSNGPDHWPDVCSTGEKQSPINIMSDDAVKTDLGSLKFVRYDYAYTATLTNTGHSIQITLTGVPMFLKGGGLSSTYVFDQMHFHWGAEHTIDGNRDALELHMVHYAKQYPNFTSAAQNDFGLTVVAVLFKLSDEDNDDFWSILEATERVSAWVGTSTTQIQRRIIPSLLLPKDYTTFYRYDGSLTTPGCSETVTWFVLTEKLAISHAQLSVFENVMSSNGTLKFNYRPVQKLGHRDVYHRLVDYSGASISTESRFCLTILAAIFSSLMLVR
ncbi:putative carbonic anhydrase 3 isoform X2 [Venturia canescens]|uniref:putative carbonic anhydrase 3 isoform X2 n=1 Tax=Venturia canescens TaxID=32260 RepID=UPI001C9D2503|nr:putative carbonic anhydrase 3 isoform X2 [Venturia canescens]